MSGPVSVRCPSCQAEVASGAKFCGSCGVDQAKARQRARQLEELRMSSELRQAEAIGWRRTKGLVLFYLIFLGSIMPLAWLPEAWTAHAMLAVGVLDAGIVAIAWHRLGGVSWSELDPRRCSWLLASGLTVAALAVNLGYHHGLLGALGIGESPPIDQDFTASGYGLPVIILAICLQPAIVEELAFRGVIFSGLQRIAGHREAIIISGLAFGIIHTAWISLPYLAGLGLLLGWLRHRTGSLVPGMFAHFLHNFAVLMLDRYSH